MTRTTSTGKGLGETRYALRVAEEAAEQVRESLIGFTAPNVSPASRLYQISFNCIDAVFAICRACIDPANPRQLRPTCDLLFTSCLLKHWYAAARETGAEVRQRWPRIRNVQILWMYRRSALEATFGLATDSIVAINDSWRRCGQHDPTGDFITTEPDSERSGGPFGSWSSGLRQFMLDRHLDLRYRHPAALDRDQDELHALLEDECTRLCEPDVPAPRSDVAPVLEVDVARRRIYFEGVTYDVSPEAAKLVLHLREHDGDRCVYKEMALDHQRPDRVKKSLPLAIRSLIHSNTHGHCLTLPRIGSR